VEERLVWAIARRRRGSLVWFEFSLSLAKKRKGVRSLATYHPQANELVNELVETLAWWSTRVPRLVYPSRLGTNDAEGVILPQQTLGN